MILINIFLHLFCIGIFTM